MESHCETFLSTKGEHQLMYCKDKGDYYSDGGVELRMVWRRRRRESQEVMNSIDLKVFEKFRGSIGFWKYINNLARNLSSPNWI